MVIFFGEEGGAFGNLGVHSAVGEGAGVEDKEVLGGGCGCLVRDGWGGGGVVDQGERSSGNVVYGC